MANTVSETIKYIAFAFLTWILLLSDPVSMLQTFFQGNGSPIIGRMHPHPYFPTCRAVNSSWDKSANLTSFLVDMRQLSTFGNEIAESKLEEIILHSNMQQNYAVGYYLRMTKEVSRLFEPALGQFIQKAVPNLELCVYLEFFPLIQI